MKNTPKLSTKLQERYLTGWVTIWKRNSSFTYSVLIRCPKEEKDNNIHEWEYELYQNYSDDGLSHGCSYNTTKRETIKKAKEDHNETNFDRFQANKMQEMLSKS